ncbi:MAG: hypothetical protein WKI04_16125 [Ferruginibacter sp.]
MRGKRKYLLLSVIFIIAVTAVLGYFFYNKPPRNIQNAKGYAVLATALYATFIDDSATAKKNFTNKILEVSGIVNLVAENQQHQPVVMLKTHKEGAAINCTLEGKAGDITTGDMITIKGICNGIGEGDPDLGIMGDVYLVRCYILK